MKVKCVYSDLMCFSSMETYEAEELDFYSFLIDNYYAEEGWDGLIKLDGYDTKFKILEQQS